MEIIRTREGDTVKTYATLAEAKQAANKENFVDNVQYFQLAGGRWLPVLQIITGSKEEETILLGSKINYCV